MPSLNQKSLVLRLLLFLTSFGIGFVGLETFFRATRPHYDLMGYTGRKDRPLDMGSRAFVDAFCAYRLKPDLRHEAKVSKTEPAWKTTNSHGHISTPEIDPEKQKNVKRIVFLGGSSTAGDATALADELTWPWQVNELLNQEASIAPVDFINAAIGGYSSFESFGVLTARLRFFKPDIAVLYQGWNDMYYYREPDKILEWRTLPDGSWTFDRPTKREAVVAPAWYDHLIKGSQILTHLRISLANPEYGERAGENYGHLLPTYPPEIYRSNLRLIRSACESMGTELFVCKQATLSVPGLSQNDQDRCGYALHGFDHNAHLRAFAEQYQIIDEEIDARHRIDLTELSGQSRLFHDHIHLTPEGTLQVAKRVADHLSENVRDDLKTP